MTFPVELNLFGFHAHPHAVLEVIAYTCGFQLYAFTRKRWPRATLPIEQNLWVIVGCVFGALIGSKILAWVESPWEYWPNRGNPAAWLGGSPSAGRRRNRNVPGPASRPRKSTRPLAPLAVHSKLVCGRLHSPKRR